MEQNENTLSVLKIAPGQYSRTSIRLFSGQS